MCTPTHATHAHLHAGPIAKLTTDLGTSHTPFPPTAGNRSSLPDLRHVASQGRPSGQASREGPAPGRPSFSSSQPEPPWAVQDRSSGGATPSAAAPAAAPAGRVSSARGTGSSSAARETSGAVPPSLAPVMSGTSAASGAGSAASSHLAVSPRAPKEAEAKVGLCLGAIAVRTLE